MRTEDHTMFERMVFAAVIVGLMFVALQPLEPLPKITPTIYEISHR